LDRHAHIVTVYRYNFWCRIQYRLEINLCCVYVCFMLSMPTA
jgi:hypothetical protein